MLFSSMFHSSHNTRRVLEHILHKHPDYPLAFYFNSTTSNDRQELTNFLATFDPSQVFPSFKTRQKIHEFEEIKK